jgi:hypothetical protein
MKDAPAHRAAHILARADEEEEDAGRPARGPEPFFFRANATISWSAAADALRRSWPIRRRCWSGSARP